jgi:hypothetical protein
LINGLSCKSVDYEYYFTCLNIYVKNFVILESEKQSKQTMKKIIAVLSLAVMAGAASAQTKWNIDKGHTNIQFNVTHNVI